MNFIQYHRGKLHHRKWKHRFLFWFYIFLLNSICDYHIAHMNGFIWTGENDRSTQVWCLFNFWYTQTGVLVPSSICVMSNIWKSNATLQFSRALIEFNKKSIRTVTHWRVTMYAIFNYCVGTVGYADWFKCHLFWKLMFTLSQNQWTTEQLHSNGLTK